MDTSIPPFSLCHEHRYHIQRNRYCRTCSQLHCCYCKRLHLNHDVETIDLEECKIEVRQTFDRLLPLIRRISSDTYYHKIKVAKEMLYEHFNFRDSTRTIRISSWNLNNLPQKTTDTELIDTKLDRICRIITHYKFDIIAVQELKHEKVRALVHKLNYCKARRKWAYVSANESNISGAFLYKRIGINNAQPLSKHRENQYRWKPVSSVFTTIDNWRFKLVNFHLRPRDKKDNRIQNDREVAELTQFVNTPLNDAGDLILLGDFNCIPNNAELASRGYSNTFSVREYTNTKLFATYDNIIIPHKLHPRCVDHGICGTSFRRRRHSIAGERYTIEGADSVVGISDHLPIWADFSY